MLELIVAVDQNIGIGLNGKLPWKCSEDLKLFKELTTNSTIIVGRKTCETLPILKNRKIICVSKGVPNTTTWKNNECKIINSIDDFLKIYKNDEKYFVCGGSETYSLILPYCHILHISTVKGEYKCDTFLQKNITNGYEDIDNKYYDEFTYTKWVNKNKDEDQYLNIAKEIIDTENKKNGRNGETLSLFCKHMKFDIRTGFPLITTKKMHLRGIVEELLFFIRGETDCNILKQKGVNIWNGNTTREFIDSRGLNYTEGFMGPMYGYQWRNFNKPYLYSGQDNTCVDQLKNVVELIKNDPGSRRILLTSYNPSQAEQGVLYPCHSITIQFYVCDEYLDMFCYNRSQDFFLGTPYNIASSSLLLIIISKITNKTHRYLNITMGDTHIYKTHLRQMKTQASRTPFPKPFIKINKDLKCLRDAETLIFEDFELLSYKSHNKIKGEMVI